MPDRGRQGFFPWPPFSHVRMWGLGETGGSKGLAGGVALPADRPAYDPGPMTESLLSPPRPAPPPPVAAEGEHSDRPPLSAATVWVMALIVGVTVANNYYAQPLLADIARDFHLTVTRAGAIAMFAQVGTAAGMFLFVPLGDKFERRSLVAVLLLAAAVSLTGVALARNAWWLAGACFAVGATAATGHVGVPVPAHL